MRFSRLAAAGSSGRSSSVERRRSRIPGERGELRRFVSWLVVHTLLLQLSSVPEMLAMHAQPRAPERSAVAARRPVFQPTPEASTLPTPLPQRENVALSPRQLTQSRPQVVASNSAASDQAQREPSARPAASSAAVNVPAPGPNAASAPATCAPGGVKARLLLVVGAGPRSAADEIIRQRLEALEYTVTIAEDVSAPVSLAARHDIVLLSSSVAADAVDAAYRELAVPVVTWSAELHDELALSSRPGRAVEAGRRLKMIGAEHALAAGLSAVSTVATRDTALAGGYPEPAAIRIAEFPGSVREAAVFAYDEGATLAGARVAPARRVALFLGPETAAHLDSDGWRLFDASVSWALRSEALFVVGPPPLGKGDLALASFLERLGYALTTRMDEKVRLSDTVGRRLVFVSETVRPSNLGSRLRDVAVPIVVSEPELLADLDLTGGVAGSDYGTSAAVRSVQIRQPEHPLAAGLDGDVQVLLEAGAVGWGKPSAEAQVIAEAAGLPAIFAYEAAAAMLTRPAPERRVGFFLLRGAPDQLTSDGWSLLRAAVSWAARSSQRRCTRALDVVQALDRSASMRGSRLRDAQQAARRFVRSLQLERDRVAVSSFAAEASLDQPLTNDAEAAASAIDKLEAGGDTDLAAGLSVASEALTSAGADAGLPVIVLLTDGRTGGGDPFPVAQAARAAGVRVIVIGLGAQVDEAELRRVASSPIDYHRAPSSADLGWIYSMIAAGLCARENEAPRVDAGPDQEIELPTAQALLSGSVSDDGLPECATLAIEWELVSGPGPVSFDDPHAASTTMRFSEPGDYVLRLRASDTQLENSDEVTIHVQRRNAPPLVSAGADQTLAWPVSSVRLEGSVADDGRVVPVTSLWSVVTPECLGHVSFTDAASPTTTARLDVLATCTLRLTADDGELQAADDVVVTLTGQNQPPTVAAGDDQEILWPLNLVTLSGTVADDGLPLGHTLQSAWRVVTPECQDVVTLADASAVRTTATFGQPADCELELAATDGELTRRDTLRIRVVRPLPVLSAESVAVDEGQEGTREAVIRLALSFPAEAPASVDVFTTDSSANAPCDYEPRVSTVRFGIGESEKTFTVTVAGDLAPEANETVLVRLGNVTGATLAADSATLTIQDEDAVNRPPFLIARTPADGSTGLPATTALEWQAADTEGDAVSFDVHFGTAFGTDGQRWRSHCTASGAPEGRAFAAAAYDDARDRLLLFGGQAAATDKSDVWALEDATGAGGPPSWRQLPAAGGPSPRRHAVAVYDPVRDRLIVHGGCAGDCTTALDDTWLLLDVSGTPRWEPLPQATLARFGHAAAYDAERDRLIVFGGSTGVGDLQDTWLLSGSASGTPQWQPVAASGPSPRQGAAAAYDVAGNRLLVFGGRNAEDLVLDDTWVLDNANGLGGAPVWRPITTAEPRPGARWGASAAFEPASGRLLLFGGSGRGYEDGENVVANDAWLLLDVDGTGTPRWIRLAAQGLMPPRRVGAAAAYSRPTNRFVVFGGTDNRSGAWHADLWVLEGATGELPLVASDQLVSTYVPGGIADGGWYHWRVVARDSKGAIGGSLPWRFTVNAPPNANAGADQAIVLPATTVTLAGLASDDNLPLGQPPSTSWTVASGPGPVLFADERQLSTTASFQLPGTYVLQLSASDSLLQASDELTVVVAPQPAAGRTWTTSADFLEGQLNNVTAAKVADQLQLDDTTKPFPFIWVAVSSKGTIVKIDTETGQVLGEYWTSPAGPAEGSLAHHGRPERQRLGRQPGGQQRRPHRPGGERAVRRPQRQRRIDTSTGLGDIKPWTNAGGADTNGGVGTAADECILHYVRVNSSGTRHVSVDAGQRRLGQRHQATARSTCSTATPAQIMRTEGVGRVWRLRRADRRERRDLVGQPVCCAGTPASR